MKVTMHDPAVYEIRVRGRLDASSLGMMNIETIAVIESADQGAVTVLSGNFQDQAALYGILDWLYGFNLPLISVQHVG